MSFGILYLSKNWSILSRFCGQRLLHRIPLLFLSMSVGSVSDGLSCISDIDNFYVLFPWLDWLEVCQYYRPLQRTKFLFWYFFYCLYIFNYIDFCSKAYYFLSLVYFGFNLLLIIKQKLFIDLDLSFVMYAFNAINSKIAFDVFPQIFMFHFNFHLVKKWFLNLLENFSLIHVLSRSELFNLH